MKVSVNMLGQAATAGNAQCCIIQAGLAGLPLLLTVCLLPVTLRDGMCLPNKAGCRL